MASIHPLLLCGGSGTRLWPLSRKSYPKQFSQLIGDRSLFQESACRLSGDMFQAPLVVTGADYRFLVLEQLAKVAIMPRAILIEPSQKNTAASICAGVLELSKQFPGDLVIVAPSDHLIPDTASFCAAVEAAIPAAISGKLVTFGIHPDRPETGYGWLELASIQAQDEKIIPQSLVQFVEKPDRVAAENMLNSGRYLWNSGIFMFSIESILAAYNDYAPDILKGVNSAFSNAENDLSFKRLEEASWKSLDEISIDYAIMEKASNIYVMPFKQKWSDLGSWEAVWREIPLDERGVAQVGSVTSLDCTNSLLRSESPDQHLVAIGLDNIIAVTMPDAVLISHKDRSQDVKIVLADLKAKGVKQAEELPRDYRPWGWYESLALGARFQVKRIVVHPGAALSLQSHHHRSEHWIVVEGTARVTINDQVQLISENQSVYIPLGAVHRMENPGKLPLTLIEVQTGSYLGEDDIVRFDDIYARC